MEATLGQASTTQGDSQSDLLVVKNLKKYFPVRGGVLKRVVAQVKAVDDISFTVRQGETFGLVGESGCGKTTAGRTILQVQAGTALCARPHDRQNEFAILEFLGDDLIVERRVAPMSQPGFGPPQYLCFTRRSGRWQSL